MSIGSRSSGRFEDRVATVSILLHQTILHVGNGAACHNLTICTRTVGTRSSVNSKDLRNSHIRNVNVCPTRTIGRSLNLLNPVRTTDKIVVSQTTANQINVCIIKFVRETIFRRNRNGSITTTSRHRRSNISGSIKLQTLVVDNSVSIHFTTKEILDCH